MKIFVEERNGDAVFTKVTGTDVVDKNLQASIDVLVSEISGADDKYIKSIFGKIVEEGGDPAVHAIHLLAALSQA